MNKKIVGVLAGLGCAVGCSGPTDESADTAMQVSAPPEPAMSVADVSALTQIAYIKASKPTFGANFGSGGSAVGDNAVSLSGDGMTLAVGAPYESSGSAGIDGDQSDESVFGAGAVYVFSDQDGEWGQQAYIRASNPGVTDNFGFATSLSDDGNTLAVSAHFESSAATGTNGDQTDNSKRSAGAAYVFARVGDAWAQSAYIKPSNPEVDALFGYSAAIAGDGSRIAVGAYDEDGSVASTNEFQDGLIRGAGAVYVFDFDGETWHQIAYLKPSNSERGDSFGVTVTISDDGKTVIATARDEDGLTSGINNIPGPDYQDSTRPTTGAVYAFVESDDGSWTQQAYIKASNTGSADIFGSRLAVSGDGNVLVVGAQFEDSDAQGINGPQDNDVAQEAGAAYLFTREGETWAQEAYIKGSNTETFDEFGSSVSISTDGSLIAIGAYLEDRGATGVGGDQSDNSVPDSGAVYLFRR